ncbi:hypothetical protein [uncultured Methanobrevibacter sp.]|uniref:hypothetical protein n=1 Tax=uncultured Methanobrevibacter sp. TaxID=253161 RepID=UPI0025F2E43E|nr:hypothetical protein [uncultured Methanobrevibacter sp.]
MNVPSNNTPRDIAEEAFAEQIEILENKYQNADAGSDEEFITNMALKVLSDINISVAKILAPVDVKDILDLLIPALAKINDKIQTNIK